MPCLNISKVRFENTFQERIVESHQIQQVWNLHKYHYNLLHFDEQRIQEV